MEILLKNVAELPQPYDGARYLIESTWPENIQDFDLTPYRWAKALVPSYELMEISQRRSWNKEDFQRAYWAELERPEAQWAIQKLFEENQQGYVTFLYAGPSSLKSNAYSLKKYLSTYGCPRQEVQVAQALSLAA